jgi:hypothetical protein
MRHKKIFLLAALSFSLVSLFNDSAFSQTRNPSQSKGGAMTTEEAVRAGNKAIVEDDWANAELSFREAARLDSEQALWRIQLAIALGQQKKWKEAFKEVEESVRLGALDWLLTINEKMPDGKVAYVNTEIFGDEQQGISRYVKAVKENKKVKSVASDIGVKLEAFAKLHKLALIYDISKFRHLRFETGKTTDATSDFIAYYNKLYKD